MYFINRSSHGDLVIKPQAKIFLAWENSIVTILYQQVWLLKEKKTASNFITVKFLCQTLIIVSFEKALQEMNGIPVLWLRREADFFGIVILIFRTGLYLPLST